MMIDVVFGVDDPDCVNSGSGIGGGPDQRAQKPVAFPAGFFEIPCLERAVMAHGLSVFVKNRVTTPPGPVVVPEVMVGFVPRDTNGGADWFDVRSWHEGGDSDVPRS